jgi:hypothetical protein
MMRRRLKLEAVVITILSVTGVNAPCTADTQKPCDAALDATGINHETLLALANRFAPIIFYAPDEPNLPVSVDRYVQNSELWFYSEDCNPTRAKIGRLTDALGSDKAVPSCRADNEMVAAAGTRSLLKKTTFYLSNVPEGDRRGSSDTKLWATYCHAYRNDIGGLTLQYWRFYAYNTGYFIGLRLDAASHGGDWEAIHVVLGPGETFSPVQIRLLGHTQITTTPWRDVITTGGHPMVLAEKGSHTSQLATRRDLSKRRNFIEHETWSGGAVRWPDGRRSDSGLLMLLGQKTCPEPGMQWLRYSGLWGTREQSGVLAYYRSGYWGPAFNETGMHKDGFVSAWCEGIARPAAASGAAAIRRECYPAQIVQ